MVEIDGCKEKLVQHDKIESDFVKTAAKVIQREYMSNPDVIDFSMMALASSSDD